MTDNTKARMRLLVTGGCGYVGTILTNRLIDLGHEVVVFDTLWFGNYLQPHENLTLVRGDIRDHDSVPVDGIDAILHMANIANDPCVDLDPVLSWEVNVLATMQLIERAKRAGVGQFIFASSGLPVRSWRSISAAPIIKALPGIKNSSGHLKNLKYSPVSVG